MSLKISIDIARTLYSHMKVDRVDRLMTDFWLGNHDCIIRFICRSAEVFQGNGTPTKA